MPSATSVVTVGRERRGREERDVGLAEAEPALAGRVHGDADGVVRRLVAPVGLHDDPAEAHRAAPDAAREVGDEREVHLRQQGEIDAAREGERARGRAGLGDAEQVRVADGCLGRDGELAVEGALRGLAAVERVQRLEAALRRGRPRGRGREQRRRHRAGSADRARRVESMAVRADCRTSTGFAARSARAAGRVGEFSNPLRVSPGSPPRWPVARVCLRSRPAAVFRFASLAAAAFAGMEVSAYVLHRFVFHGPLWGVHRTHHEPGHRHGPFEANDLFSLGFAAASMGRCGRDGSDAVGGDRLPVGIGMAAYGGLYFVLHDLYAHGRFAPFRTTNAAARAVKRAHGRHHQSLSRGGQEPYGLFLFPPAYGRRFQRRRDAAPARLDLARPAPRDADAR